MKPEHYVRVLGVRDAEFLRALEQRTADISPRAGRPCDLIFYGADTIAALAKLSSLRRQIRDNGAIWVVSRKGREARFRVTDVIAAARAAGLVDNKVVSLSATHTSLRLVVPLALRRPQP